MGCDVRESRRIVPSQARLRPRNGHDRKTHDDVEGAENRQRGQCGAARDQRQGAVLDWPAKEGDAPPVLRTGSNGWTCMPDKPHTELNDPACLDKPWMDWVNAYLAHKAPTTTSAGIGHMLAPGGGWSSKTDPYAMKTTADNQWHMAPPHVMILVPDLNSLAGMSTDPKSGGPYVMYSGTPNAHIMRRWRQRR